MEDIEPTHLLFGDDYFINHSLQVKCLEAPIHFDVIATLSIVSVI